MDKKFFIWAVVLIGLFFGGTVIYQKRQNQKIDDTYTREDVIKDIVARPKETINAKYQYKNGQHIFVGQLVLPTPCHTVEIEAVQKETETEIVIKTASSAEMCAQVISEKTFRIDFTGERDDLIVASLNGEVVNLNLFEVPENENIDDLQFDIKG